MMAANRFWLTLKFPSGEELEVRIARASCWNSSISNLNGSRALRPGAKPGKRPEPVIDGMKFNVLD